VVEFRILVLFWIKKLNSDICITFFSSVSSCIQVYKILTRLPSNLKHITCECMCFWSGNKDGSQTILSAISKNPMLHINFAALIFDRIAVIAD